MDSALSPRDIQARIRAGESVEQVALAAGVSAERIEPFAAPVIAERFHVAGLAQSNPVRRRGETTSHRTLRNATTEALVARGIDPDDVTWDASLLGARRWQITATFAKSGRPHEAQFVYDVNGRFSVAGNDDARWMIGEAGPALVRPEPAPRASQADDQLALVRALADAPDDGETDDAYVESELAEVDGVVDLVSTDPEMDALYDMLASFDEDSVKIYAGLVSPFEPPVLPDAPRPRSADTPPLPEGARVEPVYVPDDVAAREHQGATGPRAGVPVPEPTPDDEGTTADEAQQPTLVDEPAPSPKKQRRASVPSWDEIMFGAPRRPTGKG